MRRRTGWRRERTFRAGSAGDEYEKWERYFSLSEREGERSSTE